MSDLQDKYQEILDSLPEEELLDFDPFLVGESSTRPSRSTSQLVGIFSVSDLKNVKEEDPILVKSDLEDWSNQFESIETDVDTHFFNEKKKAYQVFDYLRIKSQQATGLVKEADLIVSEDDKYLLDYLKGKLVLDKYLVTTLAQLLVYRDMGFAEVKFYKKCDCALCNAADRSVYDLNVVIQNIGVGCFPVHSVCDCEYIPVIRSRNEFVTLSELEVNGTIFTNLPCEFGKFVEDLPINYKRVEFRDLSKISGWSGECVVDRGDHLLVHENYLGNYSPIEFLEFWLFEDGELESSDEVLFYDGRQVQLVEGRYIDIATKEVVEI